MDDVQKNHRALRCPRTGFPMRPITIDGITVDVSEGCGGLWFDNFEFEKFDDACEPHGAALLAMIEPMEQTVDTRPRLQSPLDPQTTMMRRHFSPAHTLVIDECPATGGIWLDPGELRSIRDLFENASDRQQAETVFVQDLRHAFVHDTAEPDAGERKTQRWFNLIQWFMGHKKQATAAA